ncbi:winged helix-turn-helix domain-containing protein [Lysobacter hankyongensis]|uniref:Winged helix-turn-helix domain-containing protein n=1 Tax=Lysobacter hankyongensis TaxID=1176535 RepID=A0ABP9AHH6_9GAMM
MLVQPDRLIVSVDGTDTELEPRMMEVLVALAEHAGEVVSSEQLLIEVWRGTFYGDNPVHKAIAYLRKVFGDDLKSPRYIETIRKRGYRLIAKVSYPDDYRRVALQTSAWNGANPYVGLSAFDDEHAGVFFGRSRVTAELLAAMRQQIDNQRRFLLIVGASGCGKTSLLNAGALPLLRQDGGFDGLRALSVARCDLAGIDTGDALLHLAASLAQWTLGGRPVFSPGPASDLAAAIRQSPESIVATIEDAFRRHPSREFADQRYAHLLLTIDHAEALVANRARDPERHDPQRDAAFSRALHFLCESPRVMVAMIVRGDFYLALVEAYPEIADRKLGEGHFDVLTPRPGEIAQIIRTPAALAGLTFEEDAQTAEHLDDVLRDAANAHADALPLLQHTLQALYERRSDDGELRFDAYRAIGGLEGALAHRAEEVFAALPEAARRGLDSLFSQSIVMQQDNDSISAHRVAWSALDDNARALAEAFVRARLFVAELSDGLAGVRVVHEALLRQWPRARDWIQDNRRLLQAKARMRRAAARWIEEGRSADQLLNPGRPLQDALEAARQLPDDLSDEEHAFLQASAKLDRRKRRLRATAIAGLAIFAVISAALALLATQARDEAERRREEALQLADFMLVDLADKLRPLGNLGLLDSISAKALAQLERRPEAQTRTEDLINRSRALRTAGEVMTEKAKLDEAKSAFERASAAARAAVERAPESTDAIAELGVAAYWLGYHHYRQGSLDEARRHWSTYLRTSEQLIRLQPERPEWQIELSYALNNLGAVARDQGQIGEALAYFRRSARLKAAVLSTRPDDDALRYDLVDTLSWISSGDVSEGRLSEAASGYAEQIAMLRRLVGKKPDALVWKRRLATSLLSAGQLASSRGDPDEARARIEESIAKLSELTRNEPDNKVWARDLILAHIEAGEIADGRGDARSRAAHASFAERMIRDMQASGDASTALRRLDAASRLLMARSQPDAAIADAMHDAAISDLQRIADASNGGIHETFLLAKALISRGAYHSRHGSTLEAREDWTRATALLGSTAKTSKDPHVIAALVGAHLLLGERERVETQRAWLSRIGYRAPDFVDIAGAGDAPQQSSRAR